MTRVYISRDGDRHSLRLSGHARPAAGEGDGGQACAAASALVYALAGWLEEAGVPHRLRLASGEALIEAAALELDGAEAGEKDGPADAAALSAKRAALAAAFSLVETGLRQLAQARPALLRIVGE